MRRPTWPAADAAFAASDFRTPACGQVRQVSGTALMAAKGGAAITYAVQR
jgi:hypothetical protein